MEPPIYISTIADLPGSSGLGSSSCFAVGLLNALHTLKGERVSSAQLAEEACHIEINLLKNPIGKQDQYACAFGGLNYIVFHPNHKVSIDHLHLPHHQIENFFESTLLFWTTLTRDSGSVLKEQRENTGGRLCELSAMRDMATRISDVVSGGMDGPVIGQILNEGWQLKKQLASSISTPRIDDWYQRAIEAGAYGGKLCGAGGGGFLLFVCSPADKPKIRTALAELTDVPICYESQGSSVVYLE